MELHQVLKEVALAWVPVAPAQGQDRYVDDVLSKQNALEDPDLHKSPSRLQSIPTPNRRIHLSFRAEFYFSLNRRKFYES